MKKEIVIRNQKVSYWVKKSRRARHISLSVHPDATVRLTIPWHASENQGRKFIIQKASWLLEKIAFFQNKKPAGIPRSSRRDYKKYKELARKVVQEKLEYFGSFYHLSPKRVAIRCTRTRWGSCSKRGNLNFSYRLIYLPEKLADYIVVHELCHLKEFNHSRNFWNLVAKTVPDYKEIRKKIRVM